MELKSRSFTFKEPHVAREPQVADPWSMGYFPVKNFQNARIFVFEKINFKLIEFSQAQRFSAFLYPALDLLNLIVSHVFAFIDFLHLLYALISFCF